MTHKEMCMNWVEARKEEDDQGQWWWIMPEVPFTRICGPFKSEQALDDALWEAALEHAHEDWVA